jgi:hypothetical protein
MFTEAVTRDGTPVPYGIGWNLDRLDGARLVTHGGSHVGATADLLLLPESRFVLALLSNANSAHLGSAARAIARSWLARSSLARPPGK